MKIMKQSKYLVRVAFMSVMMAVLLMVTGCGGDDFEGDWISTGVVQGPGTDVVVICSIQKNGNGYVMKQKRMALSPSVKDPDGAKILYYCWGDLHEGDPVGGTAKDNILRLTKGETSATATYVESDKTLQLDDQWSDIPHLKLQKVKDMDEDIEAMKDKLIEEKKQKNAEYEIDVVSYEMWNQKKEENDAKPPMTFEKLQDSGDGQIWY